jgi:hypothetical protein
MPIEFHCDHGKRLVLAKAYGILTEEEIFGYQREVWSREEMIGYDEVIDMSECGKIVSPRSDRIRNLAALAASMDSRSTRTKFAIVAKDDFAFGLGRMYRAYRILNDRSKREVAVFRTMEDALAWIGHK